MVDRPDHICFDSSPGDLQCGPRSARAGGPPRRAGLRDESHRETIQAVRQLILDDDRIFPTEPKARAIARQIFTEIAPLPLISMHGHVDAAVLANDEPFANPARLLVIPDHYVTRMLVSQGVSLDSLGVSRRGGAPVETDPRKIWRTFCAGWRYFRGTPSRLWLTQQLHDIFGVTA